MRMTSGPALPGLVVLHLPCPQHRAGDVVETVRAAACLLHRGASEDSNPPFAVLPKLCTPVWNCVGPGEAVPLSGSSWVFSEHPVTDVLLQKRSIQSISTVDVRGRLRTRCLMFSVAPNIES